MAIVLAGCATAPATWQSPTLQPLTVGWQQFFRVQWDASHLDKQSIVEGYLTNVWGYWVRDTQLLVSGYDPSGALVGQLVAWGPFRIPPSGRVYFNVPVPPAASYEVSVFSWTWILDDDWDEFRFR